MNRLKVVFLKLVQLVISLISQKLNLGNGSTWPGHIALYIYPGILSYFSHQFSQGIILVAGTNGKTTTALLLKTVLEKNDLKTIHNGSGANLLNGIVSSLLGCSNFYGKINADYGIFEVDEASLPLVLSHLNHSRISLVLLNLFRDQLDRYGEVDTIARKWLDCFRNYPQMTIIANCDDPGICYLVKKFCGRKLFFGLNDSKLGFETKEHAADSTYCPGCGGKLLYKKIYFSHLGHWRCLNCGLERSKPDLTRAFSPLAGVYNLYNSLAANLTLLNLNFSQLQIERSLQNFKPAFGRQEEFLWEGQKFQMFLAKNPVGMNASLKTYVELSGKNKHPIIFALNDLIPDGRDVSWIWDVDFEVLHGHLDFIVCTGLRAFDLAVRLKHANLGIKIDVGEDFKDALKMVLKNKKKCYIFPTYSAMLGIRKILSGKKIL